MDKHLLPEWLEKYPVFGLEMKLAWRRTAKRWKFLKYLVPLKSDKLVSIFFKSILDLILLVLFAFVMAYVYLHRKEIVYAILDSDTYLNFSVILLFFIYIMIVTVPAFLGSECFALSQNLFYSSDFRAFSLNPIRLSVEIFAARILRNISAPVLLAFVYLLYCYTMSCLDSYHINGPTIEHPWYLFSATLILYFFVFSISSLIGTTRLDLVKRKFAVIGLWFMVAIIPYAIVASLPVFIFNAGYKPYSSNYYWMAFLSAVFPLGSLLTSLGWSSCFSSFGVDFQTRTDVCFALATSMLQILYAALALSVASRRFVHMLHTPQPAGSGKKGKR